MYTLEPQGEAQCGFEDYFMEILEVWLSWCVQNGKSTSLDYGVFKEFQFFIFMYFLVHKPMSLM